MQTLADIREILLAAGLAPRKALGQNFLIDQNLLRKLVTAADVTPGDLVLEVGPGTGALSECLLEAGARVVACELDDGLAGVLEARLPARIAEQQWPGTFTLVRGDCLGKGKSVNPTLVEALATARGGGSAGAGASPTPAFKLVANLPYGAGSPLMLALLIDHPSCSTLAVTIQREVADRLLAPPGSRDYGTLGIVAQAAAEIERVATLPPECFWPRPEVTSAMVVLRRRAQPLTSDLGGLARVCQRLFSQRRKQLGSILGRSTPLPAGVRPEQRPEELTVEQWVALAQVIAPAAGVTRNPPASDES